VSTDEQHLDAQVAAIGQVFILCLVGLCAWIAAALFMALP
jgi:hypothetical protein